MKKIISILFIGFLIFSCTNERTKYSKELISNLAELKELLKYIEVNYNEVLINKKGRNRIVFGDCNNLGYSTEDYICDFPEVLSKMNELNISEVRFENVEDSCSSFHPFSEVYFKRNVGSFGPVVYYLYEYCGSKNSFQSNTIYYKPIDDFWSLYIDSNYP